MEEKRAENRRFGETRKSSIGEAKDLINPTEMKSCQFINQIPFKVFVVPFKTLWKP